MEPARTAATPDAGISGRVILEARPARTGGSTTVFAGFAGSAETRSRIELNDAGTEAEVLWSRGDTFYALFDFDEYGYYCYPFTTTEDGVPCASFRSSVDVSGFQGYCCFYPDAPVVGYDGDDDYWYFGLDLPCSQTAILR